MENNIIEKLEKISKYIDSIKVKAFVYTYNLSSLILTKDTSGDFIKNSLFNKKIPKTTKLFIIKKISLFYIKSIIRFILYLIGYIISKLFNKKSDIKWDEELFVIDVFFLVDNIIKDNQYKDKYFVGLYEILEKYNKSYIFLPRLYGINKNPFKLFKLFKITNNQQNDKFIYEYELLNICDLGKILLFIIKYPFSQYKLQQNNNHELDDNFNYELFNILPNTSFESYIRYLIAKKLSTKLKENSKIISWQEFQNLEKTFNKGIRESNKNITIYGCEFSITYKNYISMHITDEDVNLKITPNQTLLNGKYNYSRSKNHTFRKGVSLRYKDLFSFKVNSISQKKTLALLGYDINEGKNILEYIEHIQDIDIKIHPATKESQFSKYKKEKWNYVYGNIYDVFKNTDIAFVAPYAGTPIEAVSCGISVIVIANKDNFITPLVDYGKGKMWDIAFSKDDVKLLYNSLINYRENNKEEIENISEWYKENFFIEPTEENIIKAFNLEKGL